MSEVVSGKVAASFMGLLGKGKSLMLLEINSMRDAPGTASWRSVLYKFLYVTMKMLRLGAQR